MARSDSFSDQYWDSFSRGARARTELAQEHFTEYSAFTGTDIKAFILPQGDQLARRELQRKLESLDRALVENPDEINAASLTGESFSENVVVHGKDPGAQAGLAQDTLPLVNLQSITISTFRAKSQVRALGHVNARGLARGSRTVAGTFILTEFNRDAFWDVLTAPISDINAGDTGPILPDQMRPFDIMLLFAHEMGNIAIRHIYGLEIVTNGVVYSIQDFYSENTVSYMATDVSPLIPLSARFIEENYGDVTGSRIKLSNLLSTIRAEDFQQDYEYIKKARNPFK